VRFNDHATERGLQKRGENQTGIEGQKKGPAGYSAGIQRDNRPNLTRIEKRRATQKDKNCRTNKGGGINDSSREKWRKKRSGKSGLGRRSEGKKPIIPSKRCPSGEGEGNLTNNGGEKQSGESLKGIGGSHQVGKKPKMGLPSDQVGEDKRVAAKIRIAKHGRDAATRGVFGGLKRGKTDPIRRKKKREGRLDERKTKAENRATSGSSVRQEKSSAKKFQTKRNAGKVKQPSKRQK